MMAEELVCIACHFAGFGLGILLGLLLANFRPCPTGNVSPETRRCLDNPATRYRIMDAWRYLNRGKPKARRRAG